MSSNNDFEIGVASYDKRGGQFGNKRFFYIKANEPNIYRVLPPVLSLARTNEYFKYHAVHRNMRATDGKQRAYLCIEDVDYKTKIVKVRCPVCDKRREFEAQYNAAKEAQKTDASITKEKLQEFWMAFIEPLKAERQYYMNVANQAGEIGILPVNATFKNDMQATFKKLKDEEGVDPAGIKGIFVNFSKISQYKGDNKPACKVEPIYETIMSNGTPMKTYKFHEITAEFVASMKKDCRDLTNLHKQLTVEEMAALAGADRETRKRLLDALFALPDQNDEGDDENDPTTTAVPGVQGASLVAKVEVGANGMRVEQPVINAPVFTPGFPPAQQAAQPSAAPAQSATPLAGFFGGGATQTAAPAAATQAPAAAQPAAPAGAAPAGKTMSDEDFLRHFMSKGK